MENFHGRLCPPLGRLLMALIFIIGGYGKLMAPAGTIAYIGADGLPVPDVAYAVAVIAELGGGLPILCRSVDPPDRRVAEHLCLLTGFLVHSSRATGT